MYRLWPLTLLVYFGFSALFFSAIIASCVLIVIFFFVEHLQCENSIMLLKIYLLIFFMLIYFAFYSRICGISGEEWNEEWLEMNSLCYQAWIIL